MAFDVLKFELSLAKRVSLSEELDRSRGWLEIGGKQIRGDCAGIEAKFCVRIDDYLRLPIHRPLSMGGR